MKTNRSRIRALTPWACRRVAEHMRTEDHREIFAGRWNEDIDDLVYDCMACRPMHFCAFYDDHPVAAFGASQLRPNVVAAWLFATPAFPRVALGVTRYARNAILPALKASGVHRVECRSIEDHHGAHAWLKRAFNAKQEAAHPGFGRRGELFYTFAWTANHVRA